MAPKRKAETSADATPATAAAAGGRALRSSGRVTRSKSKGVFVSLEDTKKSPAKKQKKEAEVKGKGKGKAVAEASGAAAEPEDPNAVVIIVEHCNQCKSFRRRATEVKEGLEARDDVNVVVKLNPEKARRGCFEIRQQGGRTFISLLGLTRPFKPMKDLDMDKVISDIVTELSNAA